MNKFAADFKQGFREGPIVFFAPLVAFWRLFDSTSKQLVKESEQRRQKRQEQRLVHH